MPAATEVHKCSPLPVKSLLIAATLQWLNQNWCIQNGTADGLSQQNILFPVSMPGITKDRFFPIQFFFLVHKRHIDQNDWFLDSCFGWFVAARFEPRTSWPWDDRVNHFTTTIKPKLRWLLKMPVVRRKKKLSINNFSRNSFRLWLSKWHFQLSPFDEVFFL